MNIGGPGRMDGPQGAGGPAGAGGFAGAGGPADPGGGEVEVEGAGGWRSAGGGWGSSLSVAELAAVREAGFEPRGMVMGSSVYQLGISYGPNAYYAANPWGGGYAGGGWGGSGRFPGWLRYYSPQSGGYSGAMGAGAGPWGGVRSYTGGGGFGGVGAGGFGGMAGAGMGQMAWAVNWERTTFEEGLERSAQLALERAVAETADLGGHGMVGTRLAFRYLEGLASTVEFTALGTAVARRGAPPMDRPFTSHLSGQDLLKLIRAGMVPVALVVGAGSVATELGAIGMIGTAYQELVPYGEAIEASRRIAGERMVASSWVRGWAVLGGEMSSSVYHEGGAEGSRVSTAVLTGTVVRRFSVGKWQSMPLPVMRLSRP